MTPNTTAFLTDWLAWAEGGGVEPNSFGFTRSDGLCINSCCWCKHHNLSTFRVWEELATLFGWHSYPFGRMEFAHRSYAGTQHEDPKRLAWVHKQLEKQGDTK